jgi:hypothetical protein
MAALLDLYSAANPRARAVERRRGSLANGFAEFARRVRGTVAEIVFFLWTTLAVALFGLIVAGFWVA